MGSVSSLISGHSLHSKHCRSAAPSSKSGRGRKSGWGRKSGRGLDSLLKHGFSQDSSTNSNAKVSYGSGKNEDFFYIKVSHNPGASLQRGMEDEEDEEEELTEMGQRKGTPPELVPLSEQLDKSAENAVICPTAFKPVLPRSSSSSVETHNNLSTILGVHVSPITRWRESQEPRQESTSGTLSDSGHNSMTSLPTHSTAGSSQTDNLSAWVPKSALQGGVDGTTAGVNGNNWTINNAGDGGAGGPADPSSRSAGVLSRNISGPTNLTQHELASLNKNTTDATLSPDPLQQHRSPSTSAASRGGVRSPISTDESLIQQLERKLLARESELAELHTCFEEKESDSCRLFEENQRYCADEMAGLKQRCSTKLRQASQRALQTQQELQLQVLQLQQDKQHLQEEVKQLVQDKEVAENQLRRYRSQQNQLGLGYQLAPTLEETQWEVCQKAGEISLLKQQLKDSKCDAATKLREIVALKASLRETNSCLQDSQHRTREYEEALHSQSREVKVCQNELQRKKHEADVLREKVGQLEMDIMGMKQDLTLAKEEQLQLLNMRATLEENQLQLSQARMAVSGAFRTKMEVSGAFRAKMVNPEGLGKGKGGEINMDALHKELDSLREQLKEEKEKKDKMRSTFQEERQTWKTEKDKVIRYQKQLQYNYLQMHRKNQDLEKILRDLTAEMENRPEQDLDAQRADLHHDNNAG